MAISDRADAPRSTGSARRAMLASGIGAVVDWYDFFLYGTASALVFGKVFFPAYGAATGTLAAFATLAVGFLFRPLGGAVMGHFGDRIGRRAMLVLSLVLMGAASTAIGLLPSYDLAGPAAPVLLVVLRAIQGFAVGGEWGGAALMSVEHAPAGRKALYGSVIPVGASIGLLLADGSYGLVTSMTSQSQFLDWGWRIPFLASVVVVVAGIVVRRGVAETPVFERVKAAGARSGFPLLAALRAHPGAFVKIFAMRTGELVGYYFATSYLLTYATKHFDVAESTVLDATLIAAGASVVFIPFFAYLSERVGWNRIYLLGAFIGLVATVPLFWGVATGIPILVTVSVMVYINLYHDVLVSVQQPLFTEMFGESHRYSGAAFACQIASAIVGGFTPLLAASLALAAGGGWALLALMLIVAALVSIVGTVLGSRRTVVVETAPAGEAVS